MPTPRRRKAAELTQAEDIQVQRYIDVARDLTAEIRSLPKAPKPKVSVRSRDVYGPGSEHSYFRDVVSQMSPLPLAGVDPAECRVRLAQQRDADLTTRQARDRVAFKQLAKRGVTALRDDGQPLQPQVSTPRIHMGPGRTQQVRDQAIYTPGSGGEFGVPLFLIDQFVSTAKSDAPLLRTADSGPLPERCFQITVPVETAPTDDADVQFPENVGLNGVQISTANLTTDIETIAAIWRVSYQEVERSGGSGFDSIVSRIFAEAAAAQIENSLFNGLGADGQVVGVANAPNVGAVTYTTASPSPAGLVGAISQAVGTQIAPNRKRYAQSVFASPERVAWLLGTTENEGTTGNITQRVGTGAAQNATDPDASFGPVAGMRLYADASVPLDNAGRDTVVVGRPSDLQVFTSDPVVRIMPDENASALGVVVQCHVYLASLVRYSSSWAIVSGSGLATPVWS